MFRRNRIGVPAAPGDKKKRRLVFIIVLVIGMVGLGINAAFAETGTIQTEDSQEFFYDWLGGRYPLSYNSEGIRLYTDGSGQKWQVLGDGTAIRYGGTNTAPIAYTNGDAVEGLSDENCSVGGIMRFDPSGYMACELGFAARFAGRVLDFAFTNPLTKLGHTEWATAFSQAARWGGVLWPVTAALCVVEMIAGALAHNTRRILTTVAVAALAWPLTTLSLTLFAQVSYAFDQLTTNMVYTAFGNANAGAFAGGTLAFGTAIIGPIISGLFSFGFGWILGVVILGVIFMVGFSITIILGAASFGMLVLASFAPVGIMLLVFKGTRTISKKWVQSVIGLLLVKPVIAGIFTLCLALMSGAGLGAWLTGTVGLFLALTSPFAVLKMVDFTGAYLGAAKEAGEAVKKLATDAKDGVKNLAGKTDEAVALENDSKALAMEAAENEKKEQEAQPNSGRGGNSIGASRNGAVDPALAAATAEAGDAVAATASSGRDKPGSRSTRRANAPAGAGGGSGPDVSSRSAGDSVTGLSGSNAANQAPVGGSADAASSSGDLDCSESDTNAVGAGATIETAESGASANDGGLHSTDKTEAAPNSQGDSAHTAAYEERRNARKEYHEAKNSGDPQKIAEAAKRYTQAINTPLPKMDYSSDIVRERQDSGANESANTGSTQTSGGAGEAAGASNADDAPSNANPSTPNAAEASGWERVKQGYSDYRNDARQHARDAALATVNTLKDTKANHHQPLRRHKWDGLQEQDNHWNSLTNDQKNDFREQARQRREARARAGLK